MKKVALITGITGQDGSYLAELLLKKEYEVHGIIRRSSSHNTWKIDHIIDKLHLHYGDLTDGNSVNEIMKDTMPDEVYHLGAQSDVRVSFDSPKYTMEVNGLGTYYMLRAVKNNCPDARFYNAATSEMFGKVKESPQNEDTPFIPRSPYGISKLFSYHLTKNYREAYNIFAVNGILFNHESDRRGDNFVTKKIVNGLVNYSQTGKSFSLGFLDAKRDWGYAPEYVKGIWLMLQKNYPEDFVLATGETHTIKEFIDECLYYIATPANVFQWEAKGLGNYNLLDTFSKKIVIYTKQDNFRPTDVDILCGDSRKAKKLLGWQANIKFKELVKIMMYRKIRK